MFAQHTPIRWFSSSLSNLWASWDLQSQRNIFPSNFGIWPFQAHPEQNWVFFMVKDVLRSTLEDSLNHSLNFNYSGLNPFNVCKSPQHFSVFLETCFLDSICWAILILTLFGSSLCCLCFLQYFYKFLLFFLVCRCNWSWRAFVMLFTYFIY